MLPAVRSAGTLKDGSGISEAVLDVRNMLSREIGTCLAVISLISLG